MGMLRKVIQCKEKEMAHTGPTPCQFNTWNRQVFNNVKKYKILFKIRKDNLRKIFLMANKASVFCKFTSMQDLENNNWIIFYPLGNIFEIYACLTVTILLNLNKF